ncbi:hypothetical protein ACVWXO_008011 [Bradyrhizobium sp. LM2.7]
MKQLVLAAALALATTAAQAQYLSGTGSNPSTHTSSGYTRGTGTYVARYVATNPNGTQRDNFGTSGNYNPSTGQTGHRTPRYLLQPSETFDELSPVGDNEVRRLS